MSLFQIFTTLGAGFGLGAIITKLLDVWLQKRQEKIEFRSWLRDKRLEAYSELLSSLLAAVSLPLREWDYYEAMGRASKAMLIANNEKLIDNIWFEIAKVELMRHKIAALPSSDTDSREKLARDRSIQIHGLVRELRDAISDNPKTEYQLWLKKEEKLIKNRK